MQGAALIEPEAGESPALIIILLRKIMEFSLREWRKMYFKVKEMAHTLKQSRPDAAGNPAPFPLDREERMYLESRIENMMKKSDQYMDACGMRLKPALWVYNAKDQRTWVSHESFKYAHLLEY